MPEDRVPKVFVSYSWTRESFVLDLSERLMHDGIYVVLDKWELKEGQDKYAFMERCVNDPEISKVLIICDKAYADKANRRDGGVGNETEIISGEVYGKVKQEKFIPIIAECDEDGEPFVPTYIRNRIYIDLSKEEKYDNQYEQLVRNIYNQPLYIKPQIGVRPSWLDDKSEVVDLSPLENLILQLAIATSEKRQRGCANKFIESYLDYLKKYYVEKIEDVKKIYELFLEIKPARDVFLDFIVTLSEVEFSYSEIICKAFEQMYNTLTNINGFDIDINKFESNSVEIYKVLIWELFICTIAYLRYIEDYKAISEIVTHTFFLNVNSYDSEPSPRNYCRFRYHSAAIEELYKPTTAKKHCLTLLGDTIYKEREKKPYFTGEAMAEADLFLYQIKNALPQSNNIRLGVDTLWFPTLYVYCKESPSEWKRMISRGFCKKMFDLFGVNDIDSLKKCISKCTYDSEMRYLSSGETAPAILSSINLEDIGMEN